MPFIETADGTRLFYKDWGAGEPILFLSSYSMNADLWDCQMIDLAGRGFRCVAYDRRGHGRSDQPWDGHDFDGLADDLAAIMDRLNLRGATLVGHSMGTGEIVRYLARHSARRVSRAVLVGTMLPYFLKTPDNPGGRDKAAFDGLMAGLLEDRPRAYAALAPAFFGEISAETVQWGMDMALQCSIRAATECLRAYSETDFRPDLPAVRLPTLIVHGGEDRSNPLDMTARPTASGIAGSRLLIYPDAPHALMLTHGRRLNNDIAAFARGSWPG